MIRLLVLVLVLATLHPAPVEARSRASLERRAVPTVVRNVFVFESESGTRVGPYDVHLAGGSILRLAGPAEIPGADGARQVDGTGLTLLPGLIECHAHVLGDGDFVPAVHLPDAELALTSAIASGVTTVVDVGSWEKPLIGLIRRIDNGSAGPAIVYSGRIATVAGGHPAAMMKALSPTAVHGFIDRNLVTQLSSPEAAAAVVAQRVSVGARALKIVLDDLPGGTPQMGDDILNALIFESHAIGLEVWAHVGEPEDVTQGLRAGVDAFVHIPNRGVLRDRDVAEMAARDIPIVSTLHVFRRLDQLRSKDVKLSPLERAFAHPRPVRAYDTQLHDYVIPETMTDYLTENREGQAASLESVRKLKAAGVRILAGSDTNNVGSFLGPGLHHELDLLVEAGLTPGDALQAATWTAGSWVDDDALIGAVRPGWQADLLLVAGDPTQDLATVHRPLVVWVNGRVVRPKAGDWERLDVR